MVAQLSFGRSQVTDPRCPVETYRTEKFVTNGACDTQYVDTIVFQIQHGLTQFIAATHLSCQRTCDSKCASQGEQLRREEEKVGFQVELMTSGANKLYQQLPRDRTQGATGDQREKARTACKRRISQVSVTGNEKILTRG